MFTMDYYKEIGIEFVGGVYPSPFPDLEEKSIEQAEEQPIEDSAWFLKGFGNASSDEDIKRMQAEIDNLKQQLEVLKKQGQRDPNEAKTPNKDKESAQDKTTQTEGVEPTTDEINLDTVDDNELIEELRKRMPKHHWSTLASKFDPNFQSLDEFSRRSRSKVLEMIGKQHVGQIHKWWGFKVRVGFTGIVEIADEAVNGTWITLNN